MITVARAISALQRIHTRSRGIHRRSMAEVDFSKYNEEQVRTGGVTVA